LPSAMLMFRKLRGNWAGQLNVILWICTGMPGGLRRIMKGKAITYILELLPIENTLKRNYNHESLST